MRQIQSLFYLLCIVSLLFFASCHKKEPIKTETPPPIKIGLALGGGGFKGFAHIGVLKVLQEEKIPINIVTGTSAGSVVGSLFAAGIPIQEIEEKAMNFSAFEILDLSLSKQSGHINIKGKKLQRMINQEVNFKLIEDFPLQFAAVATRKNDNKPILLKQGNPGLAVRASSSIPRVFQPAIIDNVDYVDGGLSAPIPVTAAKRLGANIVIAVDISTPKTQEINVNSIDDIDQQLGLVNQMALHRESAQADIIIRPPLKDIGVISGIFRIKQAIKAGEDAAREKIPEIKAILHQKNPILEIRND